MFDPATMHEEVLLKDVPEGYFVWSPAEDYLIYSPDDKGEAVSGPLKRLLHPDDRIPDARSRNYLVKYDPATGLSERLTYGSHAVYLNDISSDGKNFCVPLPSRTSLSVLSLLLPYSRSIWLHCK